MGRPAPADERTLLQVRDLVAASTGDPLAPFALRPDKSFVFSPDRSAAIGYRVRFGLHRNGAACFDQHGSLGLLQHAGCSRPLHYGNDACACRSERPGCSVRRDFHLKKGVTLGASLPFLRLRSTPLQNQTGLV